MKSLLGRFLSIHKSMATQLPVGRLVILFINVVFYAMASTAVFSFLPKLVRSFGITELDVGYYAGIIASSLFVGRLFFSMLWGYLTDTVGKKSCAMLTGLALMGTTTLFGFSWNMYWAIVTRFLQGCSMGQIIVAKSILADICDDSQMSLGMSMVMTAFSSGVAIGPSIGGFLVFPHEAYPEAFSKSNVFSRYNVLLPNVIIVVGLGVGVVLTKFFIPDDVPKAKNQEEEDRESRKETASLVLPNSSTYGVNDSNGYVELSLNEPSDDENHQLPHRSMPPSSRSRLLRAIKGSKFVQVLRIRECFYSCALYGLYSLFATGYNEIFPLLASTDLRYHGLGFTTSQIGIALMSVSMVLIVLQITLLPKLASKYGAKKVFIFSALSLTFLSPMLPVVAALRSPVATWCGLLPVLFLTRCFMFTGYLAINIFVNNSVGTELLGSANGMSMTFASLGRLIGPLVTGSLFSWSLRNVKGVPGNKGALGFPLNQFFTFYAFSLWLVVISVMVTRFPDSMNFKKVKCKNDDEETVDKNHDFNRTENSSSNEEQL